MYEIINQNVKLNNGKLMPLLGLGCWQATTETISDAVEYALDNGYRHIDTAFLYMNEVGVGKGIAKWLAKPGNNRSDIFVTSKLPGFALRKGGVDKYLKRSLEMLNLDYLDLYLIHIPVGLFEPPEYCTDSFYSAPPAKSALASLMNKDGKSNIDPSTDHIAIWREMEAAVDEGLVKSIGVSNFNIRQVKKVTSAARIRPAVNQVEMHVNFQQRPLHQYCEKENIVITAYGPLGSPGRKNYPHNNTPEIPNLLENPIVQLVAQNHKVTSAQVLVRFLVQQGIVTIPKSVTPKRIKENGNIFGLTLSETEMAALKMIDRGEEGRTFDFLNKTGFNEHPECPIPVDYVLA